MILISHFIFIILIIGTLVPASIYSQYRQSPKQTAMANCSAALCDDVFSIFTNPAGLSYLSWREAGVSYNPSPFGLSELSQGLAAYNEHLNLLNLSLGASHFGYELYREIVVSTGISGKITDILGVGIALNYYHLNIKNYGSGGAYTINIGALYSLSDNLKSGFYISNINRGSYKNHKGQIPQRLNAGFSYSFSEYTVISTEVEKDAVYNASLRCGVELKPLKFVALRGGASSNPDTFSAGIGMIYNNIKFDYAFNSHSQLGLTHNIGVIIRSSGGSSKSQYYLER